MRHSVTAESLEAQISFMGEQIAIAEDEFKQAQSRGDTAAANDFMKRSRRLAEVRTTLRAMKEERTATRGADGTELVPRDLEGLPPELLAELSLNDADQQEMKILSLIESEGGTISIDLLLVRWFQKHAAVLKRRSATTRLYRMQLKERIFAVPGTKGVYTLKKPATKDEGAAMK